MKTERHLYLITFHGRRCPDAQIEEWGLQGPTLGPLQWFHTTYACHARCAFLGGDEYEFASCDELLQIGPSFYAGDWSAAYLTREEAEAHGGPVLSSPKEVENWRCLELDEGVATEVEQMNLLTDYLEREKQEGFGGRGFQNLRYYYEYRDANNYKKQGSIVLAGRTSIDELKKAGMDGDGFFPPEVLGLPTTRDMVGVDDFDDSEEGPDHEWVYWTHFAKTTAKAGMFAQRAIVLLRDWKEANSPSERPKAVGSWTVTKKQTGRKP